MNIIDKITDMALLGYSVLFKSFMGNMHIVTEKKVNGKLLKNTQSQPMDHHLSEDRLVNVLEFQRISLEKRVDEVQRAQVVIGCDMGFDRGDYSAIVVTRVNEEGRVEILESIIAEDQQSFDEKIEILCKKYPSRVILKEDGK